MTDDKQKLENAYKKAIVFYLDEGLSEIKAEKRAYKDVYIIDKKQILSEWKGGIKMEINIFEV